MLRMLFFGTICILTLPVLLVPDRDAQRGAGGAAGDEGRPGDGAGCNAH